MSSAIAAIAAAVAVALGGGATDARLSDAQLVGQRLIVGFEGSQVPASVRRWIESGRLAGVILFDTNFSSRADAASADRRACRRSAGRLRLSEPLLVMVDQEGGLVKRLPGPPDLSAAEMGAAGPETCREQGEATGRVLRETGFNVDLAPVLDVAPPRFGDRRRGAVVRRRAESMVARCAGAFADALERRGVAPTAKHFPGLGAAAVNTDAAVQRIELSPRRLRRVDEAPYRQFVAGGADRLVMLSSAVYPAFGDRPASFERALATDELRDRLGFGGVSITDALETATTDAFGGPAEAGRLAARAGTDLLLFTSVEAAADAGRSLRHLLRRPRSRERFAASASRVLGLRSRLAD